MTIPTNTTVVVTWEAPSDPNGVIFAYSVTLQDSDMTVDDSQNESNTTFISTFDNLIPFSNYTVTVTALTGDNGEIVGEPAMDTFMTDTGSKILELLHTYIVALFEAIAFFIRSVLTFPQHLDISIILHTHTHTHTHSSLRPYTHPPQRHLPHHHTSGVGGTICL